MNTNTAVIGGAVVVLILLGGLFMYTQSGTGTNATTTPSGTTTGTNGATPGTQAKTPGAPVATTNASVNPTATTAVVVGGVVPNGALTAYWYEYGTSASLSISSANQNIGSGYASLATPAYITGLAKDTVYYFRLVAQNQFGKSTGITYTFRTDASAPAPVGGIPTGKTLAASGISRTEANLKGEVTPNKASTQYWFEYGETQALGNVSALQSVGDGSAKVAVSLSLTNLAPATTYYFRLDAQNQFGTVNGAILNFKTSGPPVSVTPVVTTLLSSPVATTTATLRGTVNPTNAQTTYWFEYGTSPSFNQASLKTTSKQSVAGTSNTLSIETAISSLQSGTTYYYRTVAQNSAGTVRGETQTFKTN